MAARSFAWTTKTEGVIAPDERLPWPQTLAMGAQHVVAMFGATVLAPLLMGFDPNVAMLMSAVGTLVFFAITGGRVPSYLGSSFAFIGVGIAATGYAGTGANVNLPVALGGIVVCGLVYALIGFAVMASGTGWIGAAGARIWVDNRVDFADNRNLIVAAVTLVLGAGDVTLTLAGFTLGGIGPATFGAILLNLALGPRRR